MNTWLIPLLLLAANQNSGCGCGQTGLRGGGNDFTGGRNRAGSCGCENTRVSDSDCGCSNAESRFEPRFDARLFGDADCGCANS